MSGSGKPSAELDIQSKLLAVLERFAVDNDLLVLEELRLLGDDATEVLVMWLGREGALGTAAVDLLCALGACAIPRLTRGLTSPEVSVRRRCVYALGKIGSLDGPAIQGILDRLADDSRGVRLLAASTLGRVGPPARIAVPRLKEVLGAQDREMRDRCRIALRRIQLKRRSPSA